jgi:RNA polymerase sigma-70 factor (ECF subfamily)
MNQKQAIFPDIITIDSRTIWSEDMQNQITLSTESRSDNELVAKIQAGQLDQFMALYDSYMDKIYRFLLYRINHRETAEDLTSQTFLKAFDAIGSFDVSKGTFQAWLYKIAYNLLVDHYRKSKPTLDLVYAEQTASNDKSEQLAEEYFNQKQVKELLQSLPEATQELIILRIWEELPYVEISKILNKSEDSLKMQFSRAISSLRNMEPKL